MSLIGMDSFAIYDSGADLKIDGNIWEYVNNSNVISILPTGGKEGQPAIQFTFDGTRESTNDNSTGTYYDRYGEIGVDVSAATYTKYFMQCLFRLDAVPEGGGSSEINVLEFQGTYAYHNNAQLRVDADGYLIVTRAGAVEVFRTEEPIVTGVWYLVQFKVIASDTVGEIVLKIDGDLLFHGTDLDTLESSTYVNTLRIGANVQNSDSLTSTTGFQYSFSDFIAQDDQNSSLDDFLSPLTRVEYVPPNAEGTTINFTPSSGTDNSALVDEVGKHDYDTTRNVGTTIGHKDTLNMAALSEPTKGDIYAIKPIMVAKKSDASAKTVNLVQRSGTSEGDSSALTLTETYDYHSALFTTNPDTASQWLKSEWGAAQAGYKNAT